MHAVVSSTLRRLSAALFVISVAALSLHAAESVRYTLSMPRPSTHIFEVEATFSDLPASEETLDVLLPVWRPGRYLVLDFADGVVAFAASTPGGAALPWHKTEKSIWQIGTNGAPAVTVRYRVYADEFGMRTRGLDDRHGFVDGTALFMFVASERSRPVELTVRPYAGWHVTTGMEGDGNHFTAADYDEFVDSPIEIGTQKDFTFDVEGVPHVLSIAGDGNWNADTLTRDIAKIVAMQKHLWGFFPYKRYVFFLHCAPNEGGGTEHHNSCVMGSSPFGFRNPQSYRGFLGLVSHEFFHTWNVKQLRPKGLVPYDYMKENYTDGLWIAEGTTSYYGQLFLARGGFGGADRALEELAGAVTSDRQRPGNAVESPASSSFDAWVKYWKGTREAYNYETDYYDRGAAVSLVLDLEIRRRTENAASLDDVMRTMMERFPLAKGGYTLADFQRVCEEKAQGGLEQFFQEYVYGTKPLPWDDALKTAGLRLVARDTVAKPWIGIWASDQNDHARINRVTAGSPAYDAGLDGGDELLALNGARIRAADLDARLADFRIGETVTFTIFRNERLRECRVKLGVAPAPGYKIVREQHPAELQSRVFESWLGSPFQPQGAK